MIQTYDSWNRLVSVKSQMGWRKEKKLIFEKSQRTWLGSETLNAGVKIGVQLTLTVGSCELISNKTDCHCNLVKVVGIRLKRVRSLRITYYYEVFVILYILFN
jgi:hypothetical protein